MEIQVEEEKSENDPIACGTTRTRTTTTSSPHDGDRYDHDDSSHELNEEQERGDVRSSSALMPAASSLLCRLPKGQSNFPSEALYPRLERMQLASSHVCHHHMSSPHQIEEDLDEQPPSTCSPSSPPDTDTCVKTSSSFVDHTTSPEHRTHSSKGVLDEHNDSGSRQGKKEKSDPSTKPCPAMGINLHSPDVKLEGSVTESEEWELNQRAVRLAAALNREIEGRQVQSGLPMKQWNGSQEESHTRRSSPSGERKGTTFTASKKRHDGTRAKEEYDDEDDEENVDEEEEEEYKRWKVQLNQRLSEALKHHYTTH